MNRVAAAVLLLALLGVAACGSDEDREGPLAPVGTWILDLMAAYPPPPSLPEWKSARASAESGQPIPVRIAIDMNGDCWAVPAGKGEQPDEVKWSIRDDGTWSAKGRLMGRGVDTAGTWTAQDGWITFRLLPGGGEQPSEPLAPASYDDASIRFHLNDATAAPPFILIRK